MSLCADGRRLNAVNYYSIDQKAAKKKQNNILSLF